MKRYLPLYLLLLAGCQSARISVPVPPVAAYAAAPRAVVLPKPAVKTQQAPATMPAEPVLLASASSIEASAALPAPARRMPTIQDAPQQLLQVLPDTSIVRPATGPTPEQIKEADSRTTVVNIFGGLLLLLGIAMLIAGLGAGGLYGLALFIYGFVPLILSIPLLIFRSKYSTRRLATEKRKAARRN